MTGFPSETEEEFEELSQFVNDIRFDRLGCFAYSAEEDTPAAKMKGQLDENVKKHRQEIIMEQQQMIMAENAQKYIGKKVKVICEGFDRIAECFFGRTKADAPEVDGKVFIMTEDQKPRIGDVVEVQITDTLDCDLVGTYNGTVC